MARGDSLLRIIWEVHEGHIISSIIKFGGCRRHGNIDHAGSKGSVHELEGTQWSIVRKKNRNRTELKVYRTVVRQAMMCGAETWTTTKELEALLEVNAMRMLRWMCGVTQ